LPQQAVGHKRREAAGGVGVVVKTVSLSS